MDLQTRKISFVQEFLALQDEEIISRLEKLLQSEKKNVNNKNIEPFSIEEYNARIDKSLEDSKNGNITEVYDLLSEVKKWE